MRGLAIVAALLLAAGCRTGRYTLSEPVADRTFEVRSGDRWCVQLEDPQPNVAAWSAACSDDHVEVSCRRVPERRECGRTVVPARCDVTVRILRGFAGPTDVTIVRRDRTTGKVTRKVALGLYSRTGDFAPWK